jgi:AraC-like DNA-binding protein
MNSEPTRAAVAPGEPAGAWTALWPFDPHPPSPWAGAAHTAHYAYRGLQQLWGLQHMAHLEPQVASHLIQTLRRLLGALRLPQEGEVWLAVLDAQQHLLEGAPDSCLRQLQPCLVPSSTTPDAWLAAAFVGFMASRCQAEVGQAGAGLGVATAWLGEVFEGGRAQVHACAPRARAWALRMEAICDAVSGAPLQDQVWLQLGADVSRPQLSIEMAHSQLTCACVYLAQGQTHRALVALEAAWQSSHRLGWLWGMRWASLELDALRRHGGPDVPSRIHATESARSVEAEGFLLALSQAGHPMTQRDRFELACRHVQANLGRRVALQELADLCGVSARTLTQDFHDCAGTTPLAHINEAKIRHAQVLLAQGRSIKEVATALGFDSVLGFSKAYARVCGMPPQEGKHR